ncbi:hypothetical protein G9A89_005939 [Geosiphon pyriformis]|nr:hypothetical protein G9A89_005939 [Geosiphon pyriformis]
MFANLASSFVGEYHVKGVRTPGSINSATRLGFAKLFLYLIHPGKLSLVSFARVGELAIRIILQGNLSLSSFSEIQKPQRALVIIQNGASFPARTSV